MNDDKKLSMKQDTPNKGNQNIFVQNLSASSEISSTVQRSIIEVAHSGQVQFDHS